MINADKEAVNLFFEAACFGSDVSFGMIRTGRVGLAILGAMEHTDKKGNPKILKQCEFPLTGKACISRMVCLIH